MGERRRKVVERARWKLDNRAPRERSEVSGRSCERCVRRSPGLVRQRHHDVRAGGERLEETPLGAGQILEAVHENRSVTPRRDLARQALHRPTPQPAAVPRPEPIELLPVRPCVRAERLVEIVRREQRAVQLGKGTPEGVRESRIACRPRRRAVDRASHHHRPLGVSEQPQPSPITPRERFEQRVEGRDRAGEQAALAANELTLDVLDVGAVRDDQPGVAVDRLDIAIEQRRDLACVRRTNDESETHRCMVVRGVSVPALRLGRKRLEKPLRA